MPFYKVTMSIRPDGRSEAWQTCSLVSAMDGETAMKLAEEEREIRSFETLCSIHAEIVDDEPGVKFTYEDR